MVRPHATWLAFAVVILYTAHTSATTYNVVCCSLIDVAGNLTAANNGDVVSLAAGTYTTSAALGVVPLTKNVSLVGVGGAAATVLALGGRSGGFLVLSGGAALNITGVTFRDGGDGVLKTTSGSVLNCRNVNFVNLTAGAPPSTAALQFAGGTTTFDRCVFSDSVIPAGYDGSFIRQNTSSLAIANSQFINVNWGSRGSLVFAATSTQTTISNTSFTLCTSLSTSGSSVINSNGSLTLLGVSIANSTATSMVAAGYNFYGASLRFQNNFGLGGPAGLRFSGTPASQTIQVVNSTFLNGNATANMPAAISLATGSSLRVTNCTFDSNTGANGGAVSINSAAATVVVSASTFLNNRNVIGNGGGILVTTGLLSLDSTLFSGHTSRTQGAAIHVSGTGPLVIDGCTFIRNTASGSGSVAGAAIYSAVVTTLKNSVISYNFAASSGGGGRFGSDLTVIDTDFIGNYAAQAGGALYAFGFATFIRSKFVQNTAGSMFGGAILVTGGSQYTLDDCDLHDNIATKQGGAMYGVNGPSVYWINNTRASNNTALMGGGVLFPIATGGAWVYSYNSTYTNNRAPANYDGGVFGSNGGYTVSLYSSFFANNTAERGGVVEGAMLSVYDCVFVGNWVTTNGAVSSQCSPALFVNSIAVANTAPVGTICSNGANVIFVNSTFTANVAYSTTGLVNYADTFYANFSGFYNNTAAQGGVAGGGGGGRVWFYGVIAMNNVVTGTGGVTNNMAMVSAVNSVFSGNRANTGGCFQSCTTSLLLINSTLTGNSATTGAVSYQSLVTTIQSSFVRGNVVTGRGGVLLGKTTGSSVYLSDSIFIANSGSDGGVLYYAVNATITNCQFIGNSCAATAGVLSTVTNLTITGSNFTANTAPNGATYRDVTFAWVASSSFSNNIGNLITCADNGTVIASNFSGNVGVAIDFEGTGVVAGSLFANNNGTAISFENQGTITSSTFRDNSGSGPLIVSQDTLIGGLTITGSSFVRTSTTGCINDVSACALLYNHAGYILVRDSSFSDFNNFRAWVISSPDLPLTSPNLINLTFTRITAGGLLDGAVFAVNVTAHTGSFLYRVINGNTPTIVGGSFQNFNVSGVAAILGGTLLTVNNTRFMNITALGGSVIKTYSSAACRLFNSSFVNTRGQSGGIWALNLQASVVSFVNTSGTVAGGAIAIDIGGFGNLTDILIVNSSAPYGGGIVSSGTLLAQRVIITGATAQNGGGISLSNGLLQDVIITSCTARNGSALFVHTLQGDLMVVRLTARNCSSVYGTVGVGFKNFFGLYQLTLADSLITDNVASTSGGGVLLTDGGTVTLSHVMIANNRAGLSGGGVHLSSGGGSYQFPVSTSLTILNGTSIIGNTAPLGGGLYATGGNYTLTNGSRITCNIATSRGASVFCQGAIAVVEAGAQVAASGISTSAVECHCCKGQCKTCSQCDGGCGQSASLLGCYPAESTCTSCPVGLRGARCDVLNGTACPATLGCPFGRLGDTCQITCVNSMPNPEVGGGQVTCLSTGWPEPDACLPCPRGTYGPDCSLTKPADCPAQSNGGAGVSCPDGYLDETCYPICDMANGYLLNPIFASCLPLTCTNNSWADGQPLCVFRPPTCPAQTPANATDLSSCYGSVNETCSYACDAGYGNSSSLSTKCLPTGWSNIIACDVCDSHCGTCSSPSTCTSCAPGWNHIPDCGTETVCGAVSSQGNYTSSCASIQTVPYNSTCTLTCNTDAAVFTTIHCVAFLTWSPISLTCPDLPPSAPPPPPPAAAAPPVAPPPASPAAATIVDTPPPPPASSTTLIVAVVAALVVLIIILMIIITAMRRSRDRRATKLTDSDSTVRVEPGGNKKRLEALLKNAPVIGQGLTAVVYRSKLEDGTPVAIKVATGKTEVAAQEFHREAHFLGLMMGKGHPNIAAMRLYCDAPRAIVMELADGGSVRGMLKNGRPEDALDIVRQTASGLKALHDNNIAHLDMKPENILKGSDGLYKITDFGCAAACGAGAEPVTSSTFVGTPQYSSPERFLVGVLNPRAADVYSFALTVWSIYEAASPLTGETYDTLVTKFSNDVSFPLSELTMAPDTPPDIVRMVVMGIKRDVDARPGMAELHDVALQLSIASQLSTNSVANPVFGATTIGGRSSGTRISLSEVDRGLLTGSSGMDTDASTLGTRKSYGN